MKSEVEAKVTQARSWWDPLVGDGWEAKITLFGRTRTAPHWSIDQRTIEDHLVYLVLENGVWGEFGGREWSLKPGGMLWLSPGVRHTFRVLDPSQSMELFNLRFQLSAPWSAPEPFFVKGKAWEHRDAMEELWKEQRWGPHPHPLRIKARLYLLLESLFREESQERSAFAPADLDRLWDILGEDPQLRMGVRELAESLDMKVGDFSRVFKEHFGLAPKIWVARERVNRVAESLEISNDSIAEIAEAFAYPDVYSLGKQFKRFLGVSPGQYRRRIRSS